MGSFQPHDPARPARGTILFWLIALLALAAVLRFVHLGQNALVLDELWSLEIATGRGAIHQHIPLNQIVSPPPDFFSIVGASTLGIWTHMQTTHPPFYPLMLRWWEKLWGDSDVGARAFSVVAALLAIGVLFDLVRLQTDLSQAVWAAVLMGVACPQLEYARLARNYTLVGAMALLTADILVRIQLRGITRQRGILLTLSVLVTALTHYFAAGMLAGLLTYGLIRIPNHRRAIIAAFGIAAAGFILLWGPFMWTQRTLFSTDDFGVAFLSSAMPHHVQVTLLRALLIPTLLLFPVTGWQILLAVAFAAAIYLSPWITARRSRQHLSTSTPTLLWQLWLMATVALLTAMDLFRHTDHLYFIRYPLLAGPAVYAILPMTLAKLGRRSMHLGCALVAAICLVHLPEVFATATDDPRQLASELTAKPTADDLLIIATTPADVVNADVEMLRLARYIQPFHCKIAVLSKPANADVQRAAHLSRLVFVITRDRTLPVEFANARILNARAYPGLGFIWTLDLRDRSSGSQPAQ